MSGNNYNPGVVASEVKDIRAANPTYTVGNPSRVARGSNDWNDAMFSMQSLTQTDPSTGLPLPGINLNYSYTGGKWYVALNGQKQPLASVVRSDTGQLLNENTFRVQNGPTSQIGEKIPDLFGRFGKKPSFLKKLHR